MLNFRRIEDVNIPIRIGSRAGLPSPKHPNDIHFACGTPNSRLAVAEHGTIQNEMFGDWKEFRDDDDSRAKGRFRII